MPGANNGSSLLLFTSIDSSELVDHPDYRQIVTFFLGALFISSLSSIAYSPAFQNFSSRCKTAIFGEEMQPYRAYDLESQFQEKADSFRPSQATSILVRRNNGTIGLALSVCFAIASVTQFTTLLAFETAQLACAFLVALGSVGEQCARVMALIIIGFHLRRAGIGRKEFIIMWIWVALATGTVLVTNAIGTGTITQVPALNTGICSRVHYLPTMLVAMCMYLLLEIYMIIRLFMLLDSSGSRLRLFSDVRVVRALAIFAFDAMTIVPSSIYLNLMADFIPFAVGGILVLAAFHARVPTSSKARSVAFAHTSKFTINFDTTQPPPVPFRLDEPVPESEPEPEPKPPGESISYWHTQQLLQQQQKQSLKDQQRQLRSQPESPLPATPATDSRLPGRSVTQKSTASTVDSATAQSVAGANMVQVTQRKVIGAANGLPTGPRAGSRKNSPGQGLTPMSPTPPTFRVVNKSLTDASSDVSDIPPSVPMPTRRPTDPFMRQKSITQSETPATSTSMEVNASHTDADLESELASLEYEISRRDTMSTMYFPDPRDEPRSAPLESSKTERKASQKQTRFNMGARVDRSSVVTDKTDATAETFVSDFSFVNTRQPAPPLPYPSSAEALVQVRKESLEDEPTFPPALDRPAPSTKRPAPFPVVSRRAVALEGSSLQDGAVRGPRPPKTAVAESFEEPEMRGRFEGKGKARRRSSFS